MLRIKQTRGRLGQAARRYRCCHGNARQTPASRSRSQMRSSKLENQKATARSAPKRELKGRKGPVESAPAMEIDKDAFGKFFLMIATAGCKAQKSFNN